MCRCVCVMEGRVWDEVPPLAPLVWFYFSDRRRGVLDVLLRGLPLMWRRSAKHAAPDLREPAGALSSPRTGRTHGGGWKVGA